MQVFKNMATITPIGQGIPINSQNNTPVQPPVAPSIQPAVNSIPQQPQMDMDVVNLAKSIRKVESGGNFNAKGASGESGAYQWMPDTWKDHAGKILGDSSALMTPENQNAVAYGVIKGWKDMGLNPAQIAAKWNSGSEIGWETKIGVNSKGVRYNVPQYVKSVTDTYQNIKNGNEDSPITSTQSTVTNPEQMSVSGFVKNIGGSAINLAEGLGQAVLHPIDTASNLLGGVAGAIEKPFGVNNKDTQTFDAMLGYFKNRYGGDTPSMVAHNIIKTAYTDPVGTALDLSTIFSGGSAIAGKIGTVSDLAKATDLAKTADFFSTPAGLIKGGTPEAINALKTEGTATKVADILNSAAEYTNPITPVAKGVGSVMNNATSFTKTIASKIIGLSDPETITKVIAEPNVFKKMAMEQINRGNVADEFGLALDTLENNIKQTGLGYESVRNSQNLVSIPENFFQTALNKFGYTLSPENKVIADTTSLSRNASDINALQKFINDWSGKDKLTGKEFLNLRSDLADLANYDKLGNGGKTKDIQVIAHSLRDEANKYMRPQLEGLKNLDEKFAPQIEQFKQAKKDFLVRTQDGYVFKDTAINKIVNANKKGKDMLLARMEEISPGITKKLSILQAVEDISSAYKLKTGTYIKDIVAGGGLLSGNIPVIIGSIIAHPSIAVPLLRGFGYTSKTIQPIVDLLKLIAGDPKLLKYYAEAGTLPVPTDQNNIKKQ